MRNTVTIITPAASFALTTLATVRTELGLPDSVDAGMLHNLIQRASSAIASYLGRPLARETVAETFRDVDGYAMLRLSRFPVASITSVVLDGITLSAGEYELAGENQQLHRLVNNDTAEWTGRRIVVTYAGGYILPGLSGSNLPPEIEWACVMAVAGDYHMRDRDPQLRSESAEGIGARSWLDPDTAAHGGLPWAAAERLQPYRRHDR